MRKLLLLLIFVKYLFAGCSSYIGSVTINEAYRPGLLSGGDPFIEFSTVDGTDINESWKVRVYSNDNKKIYDLPADSCDDNDYKQVKLDDKKEIDTEDGMSIALVDADGNYIDYLVMKDNDVEGHHGDCNWEFDSEVDSSKVGLLDDSDTYRDPDVKGDWISENKTALLKQNNSDCSSNDGSKKIYVNDDGDTDKNDDSCDEPKFNSINEALSDIRGKTDGPYTIKVCTGDYNETLDLNDTAFDGLIIRGSGRDVNLNTQEDNGQKKDVLISINNDSIEKVSFFNINFKHTVSCNDCSGDDGKFIFDFKKNNNSSSSKIKIGNIPSMSIGTCPAFNFSSNDFAGNFDFSGFYDFQSKCSAVDIDECDDSKDSFNFSSMIFKLTSDKNDLFGFYFGDNVSKDCNVSLKSISLNMNKSSGIRFKERSDFSFDGFTFKNSSDDDTKYGLKIEKMSGTKYEFNNFNIDTSGLPLDLNNLNSDIDLMIKSSRIESRFNNGLVLSSVKKITLDRVMIYAHEQGLDLNVSEDLNISSSRLKSDKCGFLFRYGNPMFDNFHVSSGDCKYSFKKTEDGITDTAFIHDSSFGLKQTGNDVFPLDWGVNKTFDLNNSCFCPKQKDDFGAIFRPYENDDSKRFQADGNFWKYLPIGQKYDKKGFKDDSPLDGCPHEEFIDACSKVGGFVSYYNPKRDDNISNSKMVDQKVDIVFSDINISSIDGTDETKLIDFNGTVCARVTDNDSDTKMDWIKFFIDDGNTTTVNDFNSTFITQNAVVNFRWARNLSIDDTDCDDRLNTSEADSPNNFKIIGDVNATFIAYTSLDENNVSNSTFTTKKVGESINFTIASIDDENSSKVKDFNGTVCYEVYDSDDNTSWDKIDFRDDNKSNLDITLDFVSKDANIKFKWQKNEDKDCSDTDFDNNGTSLDKFAIIPDKFVLDINVTQIRAGESYKLEIDAIDSSDNILSDYNQTFSNSDKNITLWFRSKQRGDELNTTYNINIIDGKFINNDFNISDIGDYFIKAIDTDYANIDSNDTNLSQRTIQGDINISVVPYLFDLNVTKHETSTNLEWLYMAQNWQSGMNYTLEATLTAKNKQNQVLVRFDKDEYATDINTSVVFDTNLTDENQELYYKQFNDDFNITKGEFNTTKGSFIKGKRTFSLIYRMNKDTAEPFNPIRTNIKDFALSNVGGANVKITQIDDNATWYYSRVRTYDIITTEDSINGSFFITIFKENTKGFKELSLNWYKNNDSFSSDFDFNASKTINIDDTTDHQVDLIKIENSKIDFNITKNSDRNAVIHLKIPPYLWYSFGVDNDYNFSSGTNCSDHPCLNYTYRKNDTDNEIKSGNYIGGDIELKDRGNSTRLGVKIFR